MKKTKIREFDDLTYYEVNLFHQYFNQITHDFDTKTFGQMKAQIIELMNKQKFVQAMQVLENFDQSLKVQKVGSDAWIMCYALIVEKKEDVKESDLLNYYKKNLIKTKEIDLKTAVVDFSKAFPILSFDYHKRSEGLRTLTELIFKKS